MTDASEHLDLGELIILALDGSISAGQFAVLNERLRSDASARQYYREFLTTCIALQSVASPAARSPQDDSAKALDPKLWRALADEESHAPGVAVEHPVEEAATQNERPNIELPRPSRLPMYAALIAASVLLLLMGYVYIAQFYAPAASYVKLVAATGAKWAAGATTEVGRSIPAGRLSLLEGSATIEVRKGAQVTLDGGTELNIESNKEVFLASGTVRSNITAKDGLGFVVRTANALIADYGTEFTVTVMPDGCTRVHVLSGRVELVPLTGANDSQAGQMLTAGQSGEVEPCGDMVTSASSQLDPLTTFTVREEPEPKKTEKPAGPAKFFDLVDAIGGGSGLGGGRAGVSVSLIDGKVSDGFVFRPDTMSAGGYLVCPAPFIDGVFVPGTSRGLCVVSSTGTVFKECPPTSSSFNADIFNSSVVMDQAGGQAKLNLPGRSWSTAPSLYMHSNSGITFDLDEIRRANMEVTMFSCRVGVASYEGQPDVPAWLGVYVLVDGQRHFEKSTSSSLDEPEDVRIRLSDKDRFLTLIVTDGSDGKLINDNVLFIKPTIHIRTKYKK